MTVAVYYRVSTEDQTLDMQRVAVEAWISETKLGGKILVYKDEGISGASTKRPAFQKMLRDAERGFIKTVIVYKLDRLTRDALTAIRTVLRFDELGVKFVSITQPMFSHGTPFRHAMVAIFAELAQMEREIIVERVKAGLVAARARGVTLGAPVKATGAKIIEVVALSDRGLPQKKIAARVGLSIGTVNKILQVQRSEKTS